MVANNLNISKPLVVQFLAQYILISTGLSFGQILSLTETDYCNAVIVNIVNLIVKDLREDWQCPNEYPL